MKSLIFKGSKQVEYGEWEEPTLLPDHVLLEVAGCGICGTDLHVYNGMPAAWPTPGVRGHEFAGHVIAFDDNVVDFNTGDRVVVQPLVFCGQCHFCHSGQTNLCTNMYLIGGEQPGGFAEKVAVPASSIFRLPNNLSLRNATLVEPLATSIHAFERALSGFLQSVVILGAGPQGLLAIQLARLAGAEHIIVSEVQENRRSIAQELGATTVVNPREEDIVKIVHELTDDVGVDLAFEVAGKAITRQQATQVLHPGGAAVFVALGTEPTTLDFMSIVPRELRLMGTQCYTNSDFALAINLLANGQVNVEPMISAIPLDKGVESFRSLANGSGNAIKVILEPQHAR